VREGGYASTSRLISISAWFNQLPCLGGVVDGQAIPQSTALVLAEVVGEGLATVDVEVPTTRWMV
jgi:hypothetical protein